MIKKKNNGSLSVVEALFKPSLCAIDLLMLALLILIFNSSILQLILFLVWYTVNKIIIVPNLGFKVVKWK